MVPRIYGSTESHAGHAVIAMQYIDGLDLGHATVDLDHIQYLHSAVRFCYKQLARRGIAQFDPGRGQVMVAHLRGLEYIRWLPTMLVSSQSRNIVVARSPWSILRSKVAQPHTVLIAELIWCLLTVCMLQGIVDALTSMASAVMMDQVILWLTHTVGGFKCPHDLQGTDI